MKERFTVDIDQRVYLLDGELFEDWEDPADVCDKLNKLLDKLESKPLDLHSDFQEYDELISKMNKDARELFRLEKEYQNEFNRVLEEAIEHKVDFKALYGGNNATTRKQYEIMGECALEPPVMFSERYGIDNYNNGPWTVYEEHTVRINEIIRKKTVDYFQDIRHYSFIDLITLYPPSIVSVSQFPKSCSSLAAVEGAPCLRWSTT